MYDLDTEDGIRRSIEWTERLFEVVNDGAVWVVPRSGTHTYIYLKTERRCTYTKSLRQTMHWRV